MSINFNRFQSIKIQINYLRHSNKSPWQLFLKHNQKFLALEFHFFRLWWLFLKNITIIKHHTVATIRDLKTETVEPKLKRTVLVNSSKTLEDLPKSENEKINKKVTNAMLYTIFSAPRSLAYAFLYEPKLVIVVWFWNHNFKFIINQNIWNSSAPKLC